MAKQSNPTNEPAPMLESPEELQVEDLQVSVVNPERVEREIDGKLIGERIRAMRLKRSMGWSNSAGSPASPRASSRNSRPVA